MASPPRCVGLPTTGCEAFASAWLTFLSLKFVYLLAVHTGIVPPLGPEGVIRWLWLI